ncbi:CBS domain-containing protein [Streptomyces kebangsaanensis]|uniref:CBS domain-containing protein n=1 Tax=Streptomyces kebangsaanensis TaxID=864058 RepID=A0ABW6KW39_9ACTN|nr:CBS domain-containing protein [Streptomyces kebangsaanensis]
MQDSPYTVGDVMTRTVVALAGGAMFKEIVRTMERWGVSAMPVLDGGGRVIGVVSEADLLRKEEFRADEPDLPGQVWRPVDEARAGAATAEELMTAPAVTVHPGAGLARAARLMARHGVKRLPVVDDDGLLTGIVSRSDLLKVFLRGDEDIAEEIRRRLAAAPFPAPPESIRVTVREGVVTLTGRVQDTSLTPLALRLARSVEGVVDVHSALAGPPRRPLLEPDLADEQP